MAQGCVGVGPDEYTERRPHLRVRDEHLCPVDDELVAFEAGGRPQRGGVGAGFRLGQGHPRAPDPRSQVREELALLLLGSIGLDDPGRHAMAADHAAEAHPAAGELLHHDGVADVIHPGTAVSLADEKPEQPQLLDPVDQRVRIFVLVLVVAGDGDDLFVYKFADGPLNLSLHLIEFKIHQVRLLFAYSFIPPRLRAGRLRPLRSNNRARRARRRFARPIREGLPIGCPTWKIGRESRKA